MAKVPRLDYQRVNFQDAPSVATPLSAANLNVMDQGLLALYLDMAEVETRLSALEEALAALTARVTALENPEPAPTEPTGGETSEG